MKCTEKEKQRKKGGEERDRERKREREREREGGGWKGKKHEVASSALMILKLIETIYTYCTDRCKRIIASSLTVQFHPAFNK